MKKKGKPIKKYLAAIVTSIAITALTLGVLMLPAYKMQAAQQVTNVATNEINNLLSTQAIVGGLTIANATGVSGTYYFYDNSATNLTWTHDGYTNITYSVGSYTNIWTDFAGVSTTNIYTALTSTTNEIGSTTNDFMSLITVVVPANTTVNATLPASGLLLNRGLSVTNDVAAAIILTYGTVR